MQRPTIDLRSPASLVEGACAVIGGLMLVVLIALAMATAEWNPSGEAPLQGSELWTMWQMIQ